MNALLKALALSLALIPLAHASDVSVSEAWVRATVPQQRATGAFMTVVSAAGGRLVAAESAAARIVELHEMSMENNVMRMRAVDGIELPAGQPVELKSGGLHVMLIDLVDQVKEGTQVPITLVVERADGTRERVEVSAPVMPLTHRPGHGGHRHGH